MSIILYLVFIKISKIIIKSKKVIICHIVSYDVWKKCLLFRKVWRKYLVPRVIYTKINKSEHVNPLTIIIIIMIKPLKKAFRSYWI